jgi:STAM-binding protein
LYRHASLILDHLPKHPQAKDQDVKALWVRARKVLPDDISKLESLKPAITQRYGRHSERVQSRSEQAASIKASPQTYELGNLPERPRKLSNQAIDPHEHKDLAVRVANLEVKRRLRNKHVNDTSNDGDDDINAQLLDIRRQIDGASQPNEGRPNQVPPSQFSIFTYPEVPQHDDLPYPQQLDSRLFAPQPPPKQALYDRQDSIPPPLPAKDALTSADRVNSMQQFASTAIMESGLRLRTTFLPASLRHRFVQIAQANTKLNLETCGILAGTLIQNALFITKLVIPEQIATPDTCEMVDELALFEWTDIQPEGIMVLGWIHTHPTQTCFLSSRDLHTHHPYQQTLPESVAIVCSPSKTVDYGVFRLTDPPGMQAIRACRQISTFHPHAEKRIYTDALGKAGHVIEHTGLDFDVVDLRPRR